MHRKRCLLLKSEIKLVECTVSLTENITQTPLAWVVLPAKSGGETLPQVREGDADSGAREKVFSVARAREKLFFLGDDSREGDTASAGARVSDMYKYVCLGMCVCCIVCESVSIHTDIKAHKDLYDDVGGRQRRVCVCVCRNVQTYGTRKQKHRT